MAMGESLELDHDHGSQKERMFSWKREPPVTCYGDRISDQAGCERTEYGGGPTGLWLERKPDGKTKDSQY